MNEPRQFLIYQSEDDRTKIDVMLDTETLWLCRKQLTDLFGKAKGMLSEHVMHVFEGDGLTPGGNCSVIPNSSNRGRAGRQERDRRDTISRLGK